MNPVVSLLITFVVYSIIPLIFAYSTKEPIEQKKYQTNCFGANVVILVVVALINASNSGGNFATIIGYSAAPYAIWTAVGCGIGSSILKKNGLYIKKGESAPNSGTASFTGSAQQYSAPQQPASAQQATPQDKVESLMKTYANKTDAELQGILSGGYTQEAKYAAKAILDRRRSMQQSQPYAGQQQYGSYGSQPYSGNYGQQQYRAPQQPQQQYNGGYAQSQQYGGYNAKPQAQSPKFCSRCGSPLNPGSRFCSNCGADMTK